MILILLNQMKNPLQVELDAFFQALENAGQALVQVSKAAFRQARLKVRDSAFRDLHHHLLLFVEAHFPRRRWRGLRVPALDTFTLRLPRSPEVRREFSAGRGPAPRVPLGLATLLYDVYNRLPLHASLHPHPADERVLALEHGPFLLPGDLVLLDRGFPAFWFFVWLREQKAHFCTRVTGSTWAEVRRFARSGRLEAEVTILPTVDSRRKCRLYDLPPTPLRVRLIRVETEKGPQYLMTSLLDADADPAAEFGDLYHARWGIEEGIKEFKTRLQVENFSGKSVLSVQQDFHAKLVTMTLQAVLLLCAQGELDAEPAPKCKHPYRLNRTDALSALKHTLVLLLLLPDPGPRLRRCLDALKRNREPVRPNRRFPRQKPLRDQPVFYSCYKSPL